MPKAQITGAASARESRNKNLNLLFMFVETDTDEEKESKINISKTGRNDGHHIDVSGLKKPNRNRRQMKGKH